MNRRTAWALSTDDSRVEPGLLPASPASADTLDRVAGPLAALAAEPAVSVPSRSVLRDRLAAIGPSAEALLERLIQVGQPMPLPLLGGMVEDLPRLEAAGLVTQRTAVADDTAVELALIPLEIRLALAELGRRRERSLGTLLAHVEVMDATELDRARDLWSLRPEISTAAARAELYRAILAGWRDVLERLPDADRDLFEAALDGRTVELADGAGLFPELEAAPAGRSLVSRGLLIPVTRGGMRRRWARVPAELLAAATTARRRRAFLRRQRQLTPLRRTWPVDAPGEYDPERSLRLLLLTFRSGLQFEPPFEPPPHDLVESPERAALLLSFAYEQRLIGPGGLDVDRLATWNQQPPYQRIGRWVDFAMGFTRWNELAECPWAAGPCPLPMLRAELQEALLELYPHGVLEADLEPLVAGAVPRGDLYERPAARVARYLAHWGLVERVEVAEGVAVRLSPAHAAYLSLRPGYPASRSDPDQWLDITADGVFSADPAGPLTELAELLDAASGVRVEGSGVRGRLDRAGLLAALQAGRSLDRLEALLERASREPLPRRVRILLAESSARAGEVQVMPGAGVIVFRDAFELAQVRQSPLADLLGPEIGNGVVLLPVGCDPQRVMARLSKLGLHAAWVDPAVGPDSEEPRTANTP